MLLKDSIVPCAALFMWPSRRPILLRWFGLVTLVLLGCGALSVWYLQAYRQGLAAIGAADHDWDKETAVLFGQRAGHDVGVKWFGWEAHDPETGMFVQDGRGDSDYVRIYNKRVRELVRLNGIPRWAFKWRNVSTEYLIATGDLLQWKTIKKGRYALPPPVDATVEKTHDGFRLIGQAVTNVACTPPEIRLDYEANSPEVAAWPTKYSTLFRRDVDRADHRADDQDATVCVAEDPQHAGVVIIRIEEEWIGAFGKDGLLLSWVCSR
jgi:hypothetical protein